MEPSKEHDLGTRGRGTGHAPSRTTEGWPHQDKVAYGLHRNTERK
jgi:hypothetical protein